MSFERGYQGCLSSQEKAIPELLGPYSKGPSTLYLQTLEILGKSRHLDSWQQKHK